MTIDASSSSSSSSSSLSSSQWKYDVFLSFSGEDTRKGFTDHLNSCLIERGIITFRDDQKLEKGENFSPELLKAIRESWCSIIVFSKLYAFSRWCLDELVEILKQRKERKHKVFPIFYDVEPRELRRLKGSVEKAFAAHEKRYNQDKTQQWRDALYEASCITGWELRDRYESEFIGCIIKKISTKLCQTRSSVPNDLIGIHSRLDELCDKIDFGEDRDIRIVGICGMGGIGKTTLASVVYTQMSGYFECKCFLAGVREAAMKSGLVSLQEQLLSKIFPREEFKFSSVYDGIEIISRRLRHKKVLVVIDDADNMQHFKWLVEKRDWFGLGSRIIITTRDEHLLRTFGVDDVYKPTTLDESESLQLLSLKAFNTDTLENDFISLSKPVVEYAGGHPLALEVLGSFLCARGAAQWRSAVDRLKSEPDNRIHNCLQISFDGLSEIEKKIFLDIAHFFNRWDRDFVTKLLDGCGYYPDIGLDVLIKKSLLTVEHNKIWMHDLLQEMGRHIVRRKSLDEPGKRCRLSEESDVYQVLTQNSGTEAIEGMVINSITREQNETFTLSADAFSKMTKLRLLIVRGQFKSSNLRYLSKELRFFDWSGCPLELLPSDFQPNNLVALLLPNSCIERLWEGKRPLNKLKVVNLQHSPKLIRTPDFTMAKNLESLELEGCTSLADVHPSISFLPKLQLLNVRNCKSLRSLPTKIGMESLETLILSGCSKLEHLPDFTTTNNLKSLNLEGCTSLVDVHPSIAFLPKLKLLNLRICTSLKSLPTSIGMKSLETLILSSCSYLRRFPEIAEEMECLLELYLDGTGSEVLPSSLGHLSSLVLLDLKDCKNLVSLPSNINGLKCLKVLNLSGCSKLESLPDFTMIKNLKNLNLEGCTRLVDVHPSIAFLPKLKLLNLRDCKCIRSLPAKIGMESLETLILSGCTNLQNFPEITKKMELLQELYLDGTSIEELPSSIGNLSSLKVFNLSSCSVFENSPPSFLQRIYRKGCRVLLSSLNPTLFKKSPNSIALTLSRFSGLISLTELNISGRNLCEGALPNDICCLSSLETLILNHNNFVSLPANLCQLTKLLRLELGDCKKLESLPELPSSIKAVGLGGCASLEIVPNPTKPHNPWKRRSYNPIWSKAYCYSVNCFKLAGNDNALRMLKGHIKAIAKAKTIFDMLIPGSKIFEWFNYQSEECSVMIPMPPNLQNDDDQWMGIAVCCVFVPPSNNGDWIRDRAMCTVIIHSIDFQHRLPTYGFAFHSDSHRILKDHLWLGYLPRDIIDYFWNDESGDCEVKKCIGIEILFETLGIGPKVKKSGARLVYRSDMEDMDPTIEQSSTPTSTNFSDIHQDSTDGLSKKRKRFF